MKTRTCALLTALALTGGAAFAQPGTAAPPHGYHGGMSPGHGMMGPGMGGDDMMGPGCGMMGQGWGRNIPGLTPDQRTKITSIRRDLRNKQLALTDQIHDQYQSASLYRNGQIDEQAARRTYDATEKLRRQMFENWLDAQKRMNAVLTPQQRDQLQRQHNEQMQ
jgi:Spy/CpxP family protein refolding chaperone